MQKGEESRTKKYHTSGLLLVSQPTTQWSACFAKEPYSKRQWAYSHADGLAWMWKHAFISVELQGFH